MFESCQARTYRLDRIVTRCGLAPDQATKTLYCEIAHSLLHLQHTGIDSGDYSFGYLAIWQEGGGEALKARKASAARIQMAARQIIDGIEAVAEVVGETVAA